MILALTALAGGGEEPLRCVLRKETQKFGNVFAKGAGGGTGR